MKPVTRTFQTALAAAGANGLAASACRAAQIHEWKDAQGVTHYSEQPQPGQGARGTTAATAGTAAPADVSIGTPYRDDLPAATLAECRRLAWESIGLGLVRALGHPLSV